MAIQKKIFSAILVLTLATTSFVKCDINPKHKKHLAIGAYTILGAYSAKKTLETLQLFISPTMFHQKLETLLSEEFLCDISRKSRDMITLMVLFFNIAKLSALGFLTYFSVKNIIQELKESSLNNREVNNPI